MEGQKVEAKYAEGNSDLVEESSDKSLVKEDLKSDAGVVGGSEDGNAGGVEGGSEDGDKSGTEGGDESRKKAAETIEKIKKFLLENKDILILSGQLALVTLVCVVGIKNDLTPDSCCKKKKKKKRK